jgi:DNA-binding NarL/FixJ family response regulator
MERVTCGTPAGGVRELRHLEEVRTVLQRHHPGREPTRTRVLLGVGHRSFLEALAMRLDAEPGLHVVAAVSHVEEVMRVVAASPVDVAVLALDGDALGNGFLLAGRRLRELRPALPMVAIVDGDDPSLLARAVRQGYAALVPKDVGVGSLVNAVEAVLRGEVSIPPRLLAPMLARLCCDLDDERAAAAPLTSLTDREREVLAAMVSGAGRQLIAERLAISSNTVRTHMQSILTKLDVHSSLAAVAVARRAGLG